jgi:aerobic-type carbon monoxide dehydrogenase small subunit (CoxS/CutS family)
MSAGASFTLNGASIRLEAAGDEPLLHVLRNRLGLKAARFGCGAEECGACMVSVDGQARYSCTLPVADLDGCRVTTAEALPADPLGQALLSAFAQEHVGQCGYCLSGILISAFVLLTAAPGADRAQIIAALEPHLCRCGAHGGILRAVERAAADSAERGE